VANSKRITRTISVQERNHPGLHDLMRIISMPKIIRLSCRATVSPYDKNGSGLGSYSRVHLAAKVGIYLVLATCKTLGLRVDPRLTVQLKRLKPPGTSHAEERRIAAHDLLRDSRPFTALVAFNDLSALGAMTALREAGFNVPEDLSIMGFDDIEFASIAYPALTDRLPATEAGCSGGGDSDSQARER
jgi:Periplasmic binding protein-like domain